MTDAFFLQLSGLRYPGSPRNVPERRARENTISNRLVFVWLEPSFPRDSVLLATTVQR